MRCRRPPLSRSDHGFLSSRGFPPRKKTRTRRCPGGSPVTTCSPPFLDAPISRDEIYHQCYGPEDEPHRIEHGRYDRVGHDPQRCRVLRDQRDRAGDRHEKFELVHGRTSIIIVFRRSFDRRPYHHSTEDERSLPSGAESPCAKKNDGTRSASRLLSAVCVTAASATRLQRPSR